MQKLPASFRKLIISKCLWSRLTFLTVTVMILFGLYWELKLYPLREGSLLWLKILPLLPLVPGLFLGRLRSLQWLSLIIWLYITEAIVRVISDPTENIVWSFIWLFLSLLALTSTMIAARRKKKLNHQEPKAFS